jgi:TctA family transporter
MMEENLRRAMLLARGDVTVFVTRPISAVLLVLTVGVLVLMVSPAIRRKREEAFQEEAG